MNTDWLAYLGTDGWLTLAACAVAVAIGVWMEWRSPSGATPRKRGRQPALPPAHPRVAYRQGYRTQASIEAEAAGRRAAREDWRGHR